MLFACAVHAYCELSGIRTAAAGDESLRFYRNAVCKTLELCDKVLTARKEMAERQVGGDGVCGMN